MENLTDEDNFSETNSENDIIEESEEKIDLEPIKIEEKQVVRTIKIPLKKKVEPEKFDTTDEKTLKLLKKHVKKQPTTIEEWAKAREISKLQDLFGYTQDGDLEIGRVLDGDQKKIITLSQYKEASPDYIQEKIRQKKEQIKKAEEEYMTAKRNLQTVMSEYLASDKSGADISEVLRANQEVHDKECSLNNLAKYPRNLHPYKLENLIEADITLNANDQKSIVDPVLYVEYTYFSPETLFMPSESEKNLNLEESNTTDNSNDNNETNSNLNSNNNSTMSGGKKPLSMAAIMAIKARRAARGY